MCGVLLLKRLFWLLAAAAGAAEDKPPRKSKSDWTLDERPRRSLEKDDAFEAAFVAGGGTSGPPPRESPRRSLESRLAAAGAGAVTGASLRNEPLTSLDMVERHGQGSVGES